VPPLWSLLDLWRSGFPGQSAERLVTGSTAEESGFEYQQGQDLSPLHVIHTSSGTNPASYPMGTRDNDARA
jgi:hypothetical protein